MDQAHGMEQIGETVWINTKWRESFLVLATLSGFVRFHLGSEEGVDSHRMLSSPVSAVTDWSGLSRSE